MDLVGYSGVLIDLFDWLRSVFGWFYFFIGGFGFRKVCGIFGFCFFRSSGLCGLGFG